MQNIPWDKVKSLEEEIKALKSLGKKPTKKKASKKDHISSLEGIIKGVKASEKDFREVKRMWFNEEHLLDLKHNK